MQKHFILPVTLGLIFTSGAWAQAADEPAESSSKGVKPSSPVLYDFEDPSQLKQLKGLDSEFEIVDHQGSKALKFTMGTKNPYPNVTFHPDEALDLSAFEGLKFDVTNLNKESVRISSRIDNPNATGRTNSNTGGMTLDPGQTATIIVDFDRKFAEEIRDQLKGMRSTPWGKRGNWGGRIDPANVVQFNLFMGHVLEPKTLVVDNIRAFGKFDPAGQKIPEPFYPFIDKYGQYLHKDWPGKTKTDADLAAMRAAEAKSINDFPRPKDWNKYGGWASGPQLEAKGSFYTTKHDGAWYLVDPEGRLFFSLGMDVVKYGGRTVIEGRDNWFSDQPWIHEPAMAKYKERTNKNTIRRGHYKGQELETFAFHSANLQRKYGENWTETWLDLMPKRLMNWGFNTIANWSEPELLQRSGMPYTHWVHYWAPSYLPRQKGTRNAVPDPFDPKLADAVAKRAEVFTKGFRDDPFCIGFFVDNELSWGGESYLAEGVLKAKPDQPAKQALVDDLKAKYGEIDKLNEAWGVKLAGWDALLKRPMSNVPKTKAAGEDLTAFNEKLVNRYFETIRKVMKEAAPNKLYLGCRFAENNPQVVKAAGKYCDVVSFNIYSESVLAWKPPYNIDKPVIIGEFHFGASDRGVFGSGLRSARNTEERAEKYLNYVMGAAKNPHLVGTHYFLLYDQATTGRVGDAENYGIGFLSVTDTPYQEMIDASRKAASDLYKVRAQADSVAASQ